MDFTLSKQQQMVQKMYREFAENEVKPLAKKVDAEEYFPKETVEKMGKLGMMGIYFPTSVGGAGGDVLSYVMAVEELSKVCGTTGDIVSAHTSLCADCDLIVEAAFEDMKVKQTTFGELDAICKPECIFASNTSSLSITEIGKNVKRPVVGMHFFNPADRMKLIEVIAGCNTPAETVEKIKEISVAIGKSPVQVNEAAGFVVNRILIPMINEAAFIKMEGVSDIAGIDTAMKLGANHPMGPLELGDFIGLDICLAIMDVLYNETGDSKYRACPLIRKMVRGGNLGCKTGKGFYVYNADRTKTPVDQL